MLVLSRFEGEVIVITVGDITIEVVVVDIQRGKVRLGFDAPREVQILREELTEEHDS